MAEKSILVDISSSVIQVGGSAHRTDKIDAIKVVKVQASALELMTRGRRLAILIRFAGEYIVLVVSRDEEKTNEAFYEIKKAITEHGKGNRQFVSHVNLNGDLVNQSGNFGSGFNKGVVNLG